MSTTSTNKTRKCAVPGCREQIAATKLMCLPHWIHVPQQLQTEVYRLYKQAPGSPEYLDTIAHAIRAVRKAEESNREFCAGFEPMKVHIKDGKWQK